MIWRKRQRNRWFWWQVGALAVVLAGTGFMVNRTSDSPAITVPMGEHVLPGSGGGGEFWTPERRKIAAEAAARAEELRAARAAELDRLREAGLIREIKQNPGTGGHDVTSLPGDVWVWVASGEAVDLSYVELP